MNTFLKCDKFFFCVFFFFYDTITMAICCHTLTQTHAHTTRVGSAPNNYEFIFYSLSLRFSIHVFFFNTIPGCTREGLRIW